MSVSVCEREVLELFGRPIYLPGYGATVVEEKRGRSRDLRARGRFAWRCVCCFWWQPLCMVGPTVFDGVFGPFWGVDLVMMWAAIVLFFVIGVAGVMDGVRRVEEDDVMKPVDEPELRLEYPRCGCVEFVEMEEWEDPERDQFVGCRVSDCPREMVALRRPLVEN